MASKYFKRKYELLIGQPIPAKRIYGPADTILIDNYIDTTGDIKSKPNSFLMNEHHITFSIGKNNKQTTNKAHISVYNPSRDLVDYLELFSTEKVSCVLKAGYEYKIMEIFRGTIEKFEFSFKDPSSVLKLTLTDGGQNLKEALSSRYYPVGTPYKTIVEDLAQDMGLPVANVIVNTDTQSINKPIYINGKTSLNLDRLARELKANCSVVDGSLWWLPEDIRLKDPVLKLTADSGLLYEVEAYNDNSANASLDTSANKKGIKFTSLLNGLIAPNATVYVQSSDKKYDSYYKVVSCSHKGGYQSSEAWQTEAIAIDCGPKTTQTVNTNISGNAGATIGIGSAIAATGG